MLSLRASSTQTFSFSIHFILASFSGVKSIRSMKPLLISRIKHQFIQNFGNQISSIKHQFIQNSDNQIKKIKLINVINQTTTVWREEKFPPIQVLKRLPRRVESTNTLIARSYYKKQRKETLRKCTRERVSKIWKVSKIIISVPVKIISWSFRQIQSTCWRVRSRVSNR